MNDGPEDTTLFRWANPIQPKTPEQFNQRIIQLSVVERLGLLDAGGMIRVGPVHYNTVNELEKFGDVLKRVAK